jgi:hypothetical protein
MHRGHVRTYYYVSRIVSHALGTWQCSIYFTLCLLRGAGHHQEGVWPVQNMELTIVYSTAQTRFQATNSEMRKGVEDKGLDKAWACGNVELVEGLSAPVYVRLP